MAREAVHGGASHAGVSREGLKGGGQGSVSGRYLAKPSARPSPTRTRPDPPIWSTAASKRTAQTVCGCPTSTYVPHDLVGLRLRGVGDRRLFPVHRRLASVELVHNGPPANRPGVSTPSNKHSGPTSTSTSATRHSLPRPAAGPSLRRRALNGQYLSIRYTNRLTEAGIEPSVGSVGDSYDNALAESVIGLYKTELIHKRAPWKDLDHLEYATLEYVDWFNHRRLLEPIGDIPPAEKEANYHQEHTPAPLAGVK